jgi:hypothetical protein
MDKSPFEIRKSQCEVSLGLMKSQSHKYLKVKVGDKEHTLKPEEVSAEADIFTAQEKTDFDKLTKLTNGLNLPEKEKHTFDISKNPLQTQANIDRLLKKETDPVKKKGLEEVSKLAGQLEPKFWELKKFRDEHSQEQHKHSQSKLTSEYLKNTHGTTE